MYYVYMIRCIDNSVYTGITTDINRRINEHISKGDKCAKYTYNHTYKNVEAIYKTVNRVYASKLEYYLKKLKKLEKEDIILNNNLNKYLSKKIEINKYERIPLTNFSF